jgi:hypothetical protein
MAKSSRAKILKSVDKDFNKRSEKCIHFLECYVNNNGDHQAAWLEAGYAESGLPTAMGMVRDNWRLVEKLIRNRIGSHVPMALGGVVELAQNAKQESVRLKALQDILYRAGYDTPVEIVTTDKRADSLANKELEDELAILLKRANSNAVAQLEAVH